MDVCLRDNNVEVIFAHWYNNLFCRRFLVVILSFGLLFFPLLFATLWISRILLENNLEKAFLFLRIFSMLSFVA